MRLLQIWNDVLIHQYILLPSIGDILIGHYILLQRKEGMSHQYVLLQVWHGVVVRYTLAVADS